MTKGETGETMERRWIRATRTASKDLAHLAIDLDIDAERLAGYLLADALLRAKKDLEGARRLLPRKPETVAEKPGLRRR